MIFWDFIVIHLWEKILNGYMLNMAMLAIKKSYEYIQPFSYCFCTYVELAGDKYLIDSPNHRTNTSIINIFHQIINALRENPNLTEISFNKSYYINWR